MNGEGIGQRHINSAVSMKTVVQMVKGGIEARLADLRKEAAHLEWHLQLTQRLSEPDLTNDDKMKLLFEVWDSNHDDLVDFKELALGLRKMEPSEPGLAATVQEAKLALLEYDEDEDLRLAFPEFERFVMRLTELCGTHFNEVAELLILMAAGEYPVEEVEAASLAEIQHTAELEVTAMRGLLAVASDERMEKLFALFDRDGNGMVDFKEVSLGLKKLDPSRSLQDARARAVQCMLMCDADSNRKLDYNEFVTFIQRLCYLAEQHFGDVAEELCRRMSSGDVVSQEGDKGTLQSIADGDDVEQVFETLADRKLHSVFELWDTDGDGVISFSELAVGLRRFKRAGESVQDTAVKTAKVMLAYDEDSNQQLDRIELSELVNKFAEDLGTSTDELLEHMIMQAVMLKDDPREVAALQEAEDAVRATLQAKQKPKQQPST